MDLYPVLLMAVLYCGLMGLAVLFGKFSASGHANRPIPKAERPAVAICSNCGDEAPVDYWYGGNSPLCADCSKKILN